MPRLPMYVDRSSQGGTRTCPMTLPQISATTPQQSHRSRGSIHLMKLGRSPSLVTLLLASISTFTSTSLLMISTVSSRSVAVGLRSMTSYLFLVVNFLTYAPFLFPSSSGIMIGTYVKLIW